jgi:PAS domain S-box-containing protein
MKQYSSDSLSLNQLKWMVLIVGVSLLAIWAAVSYFWFGQSAWYTLLHLVFGLMMIFGLALFAFGWGTRLQKQLLVEIEQRASVEQTLKLHSSALQVAGHTVVITDAQGKIIWVNRAFTRMTGYEASEVIGQNPKVLNANVHDAKFFADLWGTVLQGQTWHGEIVNRRKDGRLYTEEQTITPVVDETGQVSHFIAIKLDISQRKEAEMELRLSTERLAAMRAIDQAILNGRSMSQMAETALNQLRQFIPWTRASVSLLDVVTGRADLLAIGKDNVVSTENKTYFHFDNKEALQAIRNNQVYYSPNLDELENPSDFFSWLRDTGVRTNLTVPLMAQGEGLIGLLNLANEEPGAFTAEQIAIVREIADSLAIAVRHSMLFEAERVQRERAQALQETGLALNSTLDFDQILTIVVDQVVRVMPCDIANIFLVEGDKACVSYARGSERFGCDVEKEIEGIVFTLGQTPNLDAILQTRQPLVISDVRQFDGWLHDTGAPYVRAWVGVPIVVHGEITAVFALAKAEPDYFQDGDVNLLRSFAAQASLALENAQLYERLRRHAEELEARVAERTRDLAEANNQLTELDQLKSKFIADISHEMRTPITNINVYLDLLEHGIPNRRESYWQTLRRETARLTQLIENIFYGSRQTSHLRQVSYSPVNLNQMVQEAVLAHEALAKDRSLELTCSLQADLPLLMGERQQLTRVVTNLLNNALRYTPSGSVHVRTFSQSGDIYLHVEDTGLGIAEEDRPHLFTRFYRGQAASQSTIPGVGLGLSVVAEIVKLHKGSIRALDRPGGGVIFEVRLPERSVNGT